MVTREALLVLYAVAVTLWIVWVDARPYIMRFLRPRKRHPLRLLDLEKEFRETHFIDSPNGEKSILREFFVVGVLNDGQSHNTIRNLKLNIHFFGRPHLCPVMGGAATSIDLQSGASAFFQFGDFHTYEHRGPHTASGVVTPEQYAEAASLAQQMLFRFSGKDGYGKMSMARIPGLPDSAYTTELPIWGVFTADDMEPLKVRIILRHDTKYDVLVSSELVGAEPS